MGPGTKELEERLFELQSEYDHYKEQKTQEIMEYKDLAEKVALLEEELAGY